MLACGKPAPLATTRPGQLPILNLRLKQELDSIDVEDQKYRQLLMLTMRPQPSAPLDSLKRVAAATGAELGPYLEKQLQRIDSANIRRVAQIIGQVGYPGKTLVGEPTNEVALLVIQHFNRIPQLLPLIEQEAAKGELPFYLYARMLDRKLMYEGQAQLYGTQGCSYYVPNPATGQKEAISFIWPIEDAAHVNERRKKAGFDSTVEANAQSLGIQYKPMTLLEAQRIVQAAKAQ